MSGNLGVLRPPSALSAVSDEYIRHIVEVHLHPDSGTPYWLERDRRLGAEAYRRVHGFDEFQRRVGFRDAADQKAFEHATRHRPVEDFIPASVLASDRWIWVSQTGGTTGPAKHGNWDSQYWRRILDFTDEFLDGHGVPRNVNWLFIGPMGPHTTGRLVVSIAEHRGGRCFSIDLDPRIVKIFGTEGMTEASDRYIRHIWDQVRAVVESQRCEVMFCTSRLLEQLPEHLDRSLFDSLKAIVHAGTTMEPDTNKLVSEEVFPGIPIVGMYGTSTTGISYQKLHEPADDYRVIYVPSSPMILLSPVGENGAAVDYGQEGQVATYRLTEDSLIPGFWERDRAVRVKPFGAWAERYPWDWIGDPYSPEFTVEGKVEGVY